MRFHYLLLCLLLLPGVLAALSRIERMSFITCKVTCAAVVASRYGSAGFPAAPSVMAAVRTIFEPQSVEYRYCHISCANRLEFEFWNGR